MDIRINATKNTVVQFLLTIFSGKEADDWDNHRTWFQHIHS